VVDESQDQWEEVHQSMRVLIGGLEEGMMESRLMADKARGE
jgi:hypothetical protein